jgi:hypothetical protein
VLRRNTHNHTKRHVGANGTSSSSGDDEHEYHMFASTFVNGCNVWEWTSNSVITHAVSKSPLGPYEQREMAHNKQIFALLVTHAHYEYTKAQSRPIAMWNAKIDENFVQVAVRWRPACRKRMRALSRSRLPESMCSSLHQDRQDLAAAHRWTVVVSATALPMPRSTKPARSNAMPRLAASPVIGIAPRRWRHSCRTRLLGSHRDRGLSRCEFQRRTAKILHSMDHTIGETQARRMLFLHIHRRRTLSSTAKCCANFFTICCRVGVVIVVLQSRL